MDWFTFLETIVRPMKPCLQLPSSGVSTTASMPARNLSHGISAVIASNDSPFSDSRHFKRLDATSFGLNQASRGKRPSISEAQAVPSGSLVKRASVGRAEVTFVRSPGTAAGRPGEAVIRNIEYIGLLLAA